MSLKELSIHTLDTDITTIDNFSETSVKLAIIPVDSLICFNIGHFGKYTMTCTSKFTTSLEAVLAEGQKASNVDIYLMWSNIERCRQIVEQLQGIEKNQFYSGILHHLEQTLNIHTEILQSKIKQLNGNETTTTDGAKKRKKSPACHEQDAEKNQRSRAIEETIVGKGGLSFDDIAGLKDAKQALREAIIMPLHYPHLFTGGIKPWKRILLYGPPGTGKSRLAQAISTEINSTFYCVSSSDLVSSWVGESEKLIKELFHHATNQKGRSVIFIDEIDSICRQRNSREEEHTRRVKTELLKQMEGADNSDSSDEIFLLCATNCPWELDTAFLRRYQKRIYIPLPGKEARIELMKIHTRENQIELSDEEWDQLSEKTEGYSGSDIANMMLESLFGPIRDLQISTHWKQKEDGKFMPCKADEDLSIEATITSFPPNKVMPRNVELQDFLNSVQSHGRTITDLVLRRFDDFTLSFGESG